MAIRRRYRVDNPDNKFGRLPESEIRKFRTPRLIEWLRKILNRVVKK